MEIKVVPSRDLYDIEGSAVPVEGVRLDLTYSGDRLTRVVGTWTVDWSTWQRIDAARLFHLDPNLRGKTFSGSLTEDRPVEIEAYLDSSLIAGVADPDMFVVGAKLRGASVDDAFAQTESWFAMYVKQADPELPGLKTGFKTSWAPT
ncbi:MAG: hypothetical protein GY898_22050 [Proteobacteria bacterium]|nr:hypothetical protein [Pseudomonadota bacterium]